MQQAVEPWPIQKCKVDSLALNILKQSLEIVLLAVVRRTDVIRNRALLQIIEYVWPPIHAARLQGAALFGKVIKRDVFEGNVVEIKVPAKVQLNFDEFRKPAPKNSPACQKLGQPL